MPRCAGAALLTAVLILAGCDDPTRDNPPPVAEILFAADGGVLLDGRPTTPDRLDRELTRRAGESMNEKLQRTRLQVRIRYVPGTDYTRVLDLQSRCQGLGISHVEVPP